MTARKKDMKHKKKSTTARKGFAIVGNDGLRHVVLGIGSTPAAAWKDALAVNAERKKGARVELYSADGVLLHTWAPLN